jgi:hypothetical protein
MKATEAKLMTRVPKQTDRLTPDSRQIQTLSDSTTGATISSCAFLAIRVATVRT